MANNTFKYFILTGDPGVGKTTLTKKLSSLVSEKGVKTVGFYTEEVRKGGVREGFDVVTFDGKRGRLSRDVALLNERLKFRVGKYGVLVQEFENIALPCLNELDNNTSQLLVIDEIGKMEFFSRPFRDRVKEIFNHTSDYVVLATIPIFDSYLIVEAIRNNSQAKVWTVTRQNREHLHEDILMEMKKTLNFS